jgi:hypothetical protein
MVEKDSAYLHLKKPAARPAAAQAAAPEVADRIPNIDHRYGDGRAEVIGIAVVDPYGRSLGVLEPLSRVVVRISVRAKEEISLPIVGFMMRNHLGIDFSGTNTTREGYELPAMAAGDVYTVDFHIDLPELYPQVFSFSPAIADGTLLGYRMCDWIDNAIALQMGHSEGQIYGYMRVPCRVEVNKRLADTTAVASQERMLG